MFLAYELLLPAIFLKVLKDLFKYFSDLIPSTRLRDF